MRTIQLLSACRSFCFETTSSGEIRLKAEPTDSLAVAAKHTSGVSCLQLSPRVSASTASRGWVRDPEVAFLGG
jgi:hypothetical protein